MSHFHNLPQNPNMLERSRLHNLIKKGLEQPLLVILGGPGYGKTQAMSSFLSTCHDQVLWLRLSRLDNIGQYFWDHLCRVLKHDCPRLAACLATLGFPDTLASFESFVTLLLRSELVYKRVIIVFDDFGEIDSPQIKNFLWSFSETGVENLRIVLISNMPTNTESVAFMSTKRSLILTKDLKFTHEEIAELFQIHGITLDEDDARNLERYTEGWPLSVQLLAQQGNVRPNPLHLHELEIYYMFEERFFAVYSDEVKSLLIKLSLPNSFTMELAAEIYADIPCEITLLKKHVFITDEPNTGRLFFHHLYRLFLQKKQPLLSSDEVHRVWQVAARQYAAEGDYIEAVTCFKNCNDYSEALAMITKAVISQYGSSDKISQFYLSILDSFPAGEKSQKPLCDCIRAHIYLNLMRQDKAEELLLSLIEKLDGTADEDELALLGNAYIMLGLVHMMDSRDDFGEYFARAADYPVEKLPLFNSGTMSAHNQHSFSMMDNSPHAKERMENCVHKAVPLMAKVMNGSMSGMQYIFSAEAAYLSYEFEQAQQHAYRGIYMAQNSAQHDLVCNGYCILARIGHMTGNYQEMTRQVNNVVEYSRRYEIGVLSDIRDTALAWYYTKLSDFDRVPKSIVTSSVMDKPILLYGRSMIVFANYLIHTKEYARMVAMMENIKGLYFSKTIWQDGICRHIMLAIGHLHLHNHESAVQELWNAYDMSYNNGLVTLFVEAEFHMSELINLARSQDKYRFCPEWLDKIYTLCTEHKRRSAALRLEHHNTYAKKDVKNNPLSNRERSVLQALARGLTREEIANQEYISVSTVKSAISSIYNKLGAANRAEAVAIALFHGYIEGHLPL